MSKETFLSISLILSCVGVLFCLLTFIVFHFVGPRGFQKYSDTLRKPLITYMFAGYAILSLFGGLVFFLISLFL